MTVYAFALENFNRPKAEVDGLMLLAKTKLAQLVQHGELMERYDARVKLCGKQELIPEDVMEIMSKAVDATSKNTGFVPLTQPQLPHICPIADLELQPCSESLLSLRVQGRDDTGCQSYGQRLSCTTATQNAVLLPDQDIENHQI